MFPNGMIEGIPPLEPEAPDPMLAGEDILIAERGTGGTVKSVLHCLHSGISSSRSEDSVGWLPILPLLAVLSSCESRGRFSSVCTSVTDRHRRTLDLTYS